MIVLAHVGGVPLEETLASAGPALLVAFWMEWASLRARAARLLDRAFPRPVREGEVEGHQLGPLVGVVDDPV